VTGSEGVGAIPSLPEGTEPLQPPTFKSPLSPAPALQETAPAAPPYIPGNLLTLDPALSSFQFTPGSGNIDEAALPLLNRLALLLQGNPDARLSLLAYADNKGSTPRDARRLSLTRALAVRGYLSAQGVSESRIDVHAQGANTTKGAMDRVDVKLNDK
jgi:outer membrane protein OmpA-like peptidoglycan-associated protein